MLWLHFSALLLQGNKLKRKCQDLDIFGPNPSILIINKSELSIQILIQFTKYVLKFSHCQNL